MKLMKHWKPVVLGVLTLGVAASATLSYPAAPESAKAVGFGPSSIDTMIKAEWKKGGIVPAPPTDDARFLRRVYLDVTGTIPPPDAVQVFLSYKSPNRREKAIDTLLA